MYQIPIGKTWNAKLVAEALSRHGVVAIVDGEKLLIELVLQTYDIEILSSAKDLSNIKPTIVGRTDAIVKYLPEKMIGNLRVEFDRPMRLDNNSLPIIPDETRLKSALEECGYLSATEREIVMTYCLQNEPVLELLDEIDTLEARKHEHLNNREFDLAASTLHQQNKFREKIETLMAKIAG